MSDFQAFDELISSLQGAVIKISRIDTKSTFGINE